MKNLLSDCVCVLTNSMRVFLKTSTDPLLKNQSEGLQVLQLWREKVFKLCVQLRTKDIELKEEKNKLLSKVWRLWRDVLAPKYTMPNVFWNVFKMGVCILG